MSNSKVASRMMAPGKGWDKRKREFVDQSVQSIRQKGFEIYCTAKWL
jgi:hypothetical protein